MNSTNDIEHRAFLRHASHLAQRWPTSIFGEDELDKTWIFPFITQSIVPHGLSADYAKVQKCLVEGCGTNQALELRVNDAITTISKSRPLLNAYPVFMTANFWDPTDGGKRKIQVSLGADHASANSQKLTQSGKRLVATMTVCICIANELAALGGPGGKKPIYTFNNLLKRQASYFDTFVFSREQLTGQEPANPKSGLIAFASCSQSTSVMQKAEAAVNYLCKKSVKNLKSAFAAAANRSSGEVLACSADKKLSALVRDTVDAIDPSLFDSELISVAKRSLEHTFGMNKLTNADIASTLVCTSLLLENSGADYMHCFPFAAGSRQGCCNLNVYTCSKLDNDSQLFFEMLSHIMFPRPMVQDLAEHMSSLRAAQKIQGNFQSTIPSDESAAPLKIAIRYHPSKILSGDFVFYSKGRRPGEQWIIVGDVEGKGLRAALPMAKVVSCCQALVKYHSTPSSLLQDLDKQLQPDPGSNEKPQNWERWFVTVCAVLFERRAGLIRIAIAGDIPNPILYRPHQETPGGGSTQKNFVVPVDHGHPLGIDHVVLNPLPGEKQEDLVPYFREYHYQFKPDDTLLIYSDGLRCASEKSGLPFDMGQLFSLVHEHHGDLDGLVDGVVALAGPDTNNLPDDVTVLAVHRKGL